MKKPMAMAMPASDKEQEARWRAESDVRSLVEAEAIRNDAKRLAAAKKIAREQAAALRKVNNG